MYGFFWWDFFKKELDKGYLISNFFLVEQSYNTVIESYENSVITSSVRLRSRFEKSLFEIKSNSYLPIKRLAPGLFKALSKESIAEM